MRRIVHTGIAATVLLLLMFVAVPVQRSVDAQGTAATTHIVQPGENLYRISLRYGVTVQAIVSANAAVTNPNLILVGQTLNIPGGVDGGATGGNTGDNTGGNTTLQSYTVVAGDTLRSEPLLLSAPRGQHFRGAPVPVNLCAGKAPGMRGVHAPHVPPRSRSGSRSGSRSRTASGHGLGNQSRSG
jgi:hypothetical protein